MARFAQEAFAGTLLEALNPIRDISKNWGIDLAQHLEQYLGQIAIEHGTNFAEAAMLIENSAVIYVKKVDYVWNISQALLETLRKGKLNNDKKKSQEDGTEGTTDTGEAPAQKNKKDKHADANKSKYGEINIEVSEKLLELEPSRDRAAGKPSRSLHDVSHHFLKRPLSSKQRHAAPTEDAQEERRYKSNALLLANLVLHHEFREDEGRAPAHTRLGFFTADPPSFVVDDVHMDDDFVADDGSGMGPPISADVSYPAPAGSAATQEPDQDEMRIGERAKGKKAAEVLREVPHPDAIAGAWDPIPMQVDYPEKPVSNRKKTKLPCDPKLLTIEALGVFKRKNGVKYENDLPRRPQKIMLRYIVDHIMAVNNFKVSPEFYDLMCLQERRLKERKRKKQRAFEEIRPTLQEDFDKFADFRGFEDYEPSPSEKNGMNGFLGFDEDADDEDDDEADRVEVNSPAPAASFPSPSRSPSPPPPYEDPLRESGGSPLPGEREAIVMAAAAPEETAEQALESQMALAQRVGQWHESIRPKLVEAEHRGHFDIHEYGTRILDSFPRTPGRHTLGLSRLVADVDTRDVARYFLASLQLANTYNVEISTPKEPLTMDCMELTLLSVQRHHEQLEDYVAPSQEDASGSGRVVSSAVHRVHSPALKHTHHAGKKRKH